MTHSIKAHSLRSAKPIEIRNYEIRKTLDNSVSAINLIVSKKRYKTTNYEIRIIKIT